MHGASSTRRSDRRRLWLILALTAGFMAVEVVGGLVAGSLTLIADAGHMLTDALALAMALGAMRFAERPATSRKTWGFYRFEILAALGNGVLLAMLAAGIVAGAIGRLRHPAPVDAPLTVAIAVLGLAINGIASWVLLKGSARSLNVRGAFWHVLGDALGSLGAVVAGTVIWLTGAAKADAVAAIVVSAIILWGAWRLIRESVDVLLEGTPGRIELTEVERAMRAIEGVRDVHDLHVWCISSGFDALSAHVVVRRPGADRSLLADLRRALRDGFGIGHVTVQVEDGSDECHGCD